MVRIVSYALKLQICIWSLTARSRMRLLSVEKVFKRRSGRCAATFSTTSFGSEAKVMGDDISCSEEGIRFQWCRAMR